MEEIYIWLLVIGFLIAFLLAFGIGANDVANSFGTSVGSKVLTLRMACILATIFELSGAILLGAKVSSTIRKGIVDVSLFTEPKRLMAGQVSSLAGSCVWLLIATFFRLPVSGTHSIVGATIGFSLAEFGTKAIIWKKTGMIALSWVLSPVLSGIASTLMYYALRFLVLCKDEPLEPGLRLLPGFYGTVVLVNTFSIFFKGPPMFHFDKIPLYGVFIISCGFGIITALWVKLMFVPRMRKKVVDGIGISPKWVEKVNGILRPMWSKFARTSRSEQDNGIEMTTQQDTVRQFEAIPEEEEADADSDRSSTHATDQNLPKIVIEKTASQESEVPTDVPKSQRAFEVSPSVQTPQVAFISDANSTLDGADLQLDKVPLPPIGEEDNFGSTIIKDRPTEIQIFSSLQVVTAIFGSFAHGANDVSNAIGQLIGLWLVAQCACTDVTGTTPIWILIYGGVGISVGLWVWGRRVIQTLGEDLTQITPSSGVCIEIGAALTVLAASKLGLPISTTHCKVGSVVAVGWVRSRDNVNWKVFGNIIIAWVVTLPAAGCISALLMYLIGLAI